MNNGIDNQLRAVVGIDPGGDDLRQGGLPPGFMGGPMSAANQALGVQLASTRHDHSTTIKSALLHVYNDSMRRLLENF